MNQQVDAVLETAVNQVGVNLNTASPQLLTHIAGLNTTIAQNIVNYRDENGQFASRVALKKVPKLGAKAFEQAAGFLRIPDGKNALDNTDIHPESYKLAQTVLKEAQTQGVSLDALPLSQLAAEYEVGLPTLQDIVASLEHPGRDLRDAEPGAILRSDVLSMKDLKVGMQLQGTVRNVVDFGAFVDIGVHEDGLVHISRLSTKRVRDPHQVVAVGDIVDVWVVKVDEQRQRIELSMVAPKAKQE